MTLRRFSFSNYHPTAADNPNMRHKRALAGNINYEPVYKGGATLCYLFVALPFCAVVTLPTVSIPFLQILALLYLILIGLAGYGLQILGAKILHVQRKPSVYSYEDTTRRYRLREALICHLFVLPVFLNTGMLAMQVLRLYSDSFSGSSSFPTLLSLCAAFMLEFGAYLWFIPYNTLISTRRIGTISIALLIQWIILVVIVGKWNQMPVLNAAYVLSLVLVIVLYLFLLNQAFITRPFGGKIARGINDAAKGYSIRIVGITLGCAAVCAVFAMSCLVVIVKAFYACVRFFFAMFIKNTSGDEEKMEKVLSQTHLAEAYMRMQPKQAEYWVVVFAILAALAVLLLVVLSVPVVREKALALWKTFLEFIQFLLHPNKTVKQVQTTEFLNFTDTEEKTRHLRHKSRLYAEKVQSYADFQRKLDTLPSNKEKICFAYAVAAALLRHYNCGIRASDTPRELTVKVKKRDMIADMDSLTAVYETLRYADAANTSTTPAAVLHDTVMENRGTTEEDVLNRLCTIVRTLF